MPKRSSKGDRTTDESTNVDVSVSGPAEIDLTINGTKVRLAVKRGRKRRRRSEPESVALAPQDNVPFFQRQWHRDSKSSMATNITGGVCAGLAHDLGINPLWLRLGFLGAFWLTGVGLFAYLALSVMLPDRRNHKVPRPKPKRGAEALPVSRDDVPPELVEAWREVNEITKN